MSCGFVTLSKIITDSRRFEEQKMKFEKYYEFFFETSTINKYGILC